MSVLLTRDQIAQTLATLAEAVARGAPEDARIVVIGIRRRGEVLAQRLIPLLERAGARPTDVGALDITLYRDDLSAIGPNAIVRGTEIDFPITNTWLVLVDDVIYTGRTVRAALDALTDLGRPRAIRLVVLVDRGLRELPIQPDFVGLQVESTSENIVNVKLVETDEIDEVELA